MLDEILESGELGGEILCPSDLCKTEIDILKRQLVQFENEIHTEKEKYREALISNLRLDLEIEQLESLQKQKNRYEEFQGKISMQTISALNHFKDTMDDDSKFVMAAVRDLYSDNISKLKNKTVTGKSSTGKEAISPEKKQTVRDLFEKRLKFASGTGLIDTSRLKSLNKAIKCAITNITKNIP